MSATLTLYLAPTGTLDATELAPLAGLLDADEQARADRLPGGPARRDFLAAHALVRLALSNHRPGMKPCAWRFVTGADGKPEVAGGEAPAFNLSHAAGLVAVAVGEGMAVGVDVEPLAAQADLERAAPVFCSKEERVALALMDVAERRDALLALWTLKESLLKAMGRGFSLSPQAITCALGPLEWLDAPVEQPHAWMARLDADGAGTAPMRGFQVAACALGPERPVLRVHGVQCLAAPLVAPPCPALDAAFVPVGPRQAGAR